MIEQEVNWGTQDFQQRTHFGYPDMKIDYVGMQSRDFFLLFFERCDALIKQGMSVEEFGNDAEPQKQESRTAMKIVDASSVGSAPNVRLREDFALFEVIESVGRICGLPHFCANRETL